MYANYLANLNGIEALRNEFPRIREDGQVMGKCAYVSRKLFGHPKMIEWAVSIARHGWQTAENHLEKLEGDLEGRISDLLSTSVGYLSTEGKKVLACMSVMPASGRFMRDELWTIAQRTGSEISSIVGRLPGNREAKLGGEAAEADWHDWQDDVRWVVGGLLQLEQAALIDLDQSSQTYTYNIAVIEHARSEFGLGEHHRRAATESLFLFHCNYFRANQSNRPAIEPLIDNVLGTLQAVEENPDPSNSLKKNIRSLKKSINEYFGRKSVPQLGKS